jgi:hypothetical protein
MELIEEPVNSGDRFILPTRNTFYSLEENFSFHNEKTFYEIFVEKANDYVFFICDFGNPEPRDENLTNVNTGTKSNNPRTKEQAELLNQVFFLYHYDKNLLYISNSQKKSLFESILKEKLQKDFTIKNVFKKEDDFINILNECNSIKFTHINNLFNKDSKKKQALIDLTGTDAPEEFTIEAKYGKNNNVFDFIKNICQAKRDSNISSLAICGIDEKGFEFVYNIDTFQQKITIYCAKNENGKFIADNVKDKLLEEIIK